MNLKLIFQKTKNKKRTEMRKNNKRGEIRTCPKIVAQPAVTSEKGVVFNPVRSGSGSGDVIVPDNSSIFLWSATSYRTVCVSTCLL